MDLDFNNAYPASRAGLRTRIAEIDNAMAAIRAQIASSDLQRQVKKKPIDPQWFHRAKTALRHLQHERASLQQFAIHLPPHAESLKDCLIAVLRERHEESAWARVMDDAHRRFDEETH